METYTPRRGSRGKRSTFTLGEETRDDLAALQAWSETVRLAIGLTLSTIKLGEVFKP
jgi:hypothetical protein